MYTKESINEALARGGSIRAAAKLMGKSLSSLQWWIARNGYRVEKKAVLVKVNQPESEASTERTTK